MYSEIYTTASRLNTFAGDKRSPVESLLEKYDMLANEYGWRRTVIYNQVVVEPEHGARTYLPIVGYASASKGPALWLLSGVHGEEPAGPMAIAKHLDTIINLCAQGVPIVLLPLCNPKGYYRDWRYPEERRDWKVGRSATESDHLMLHLEESGRARITEPATPEAWAILNYIIDQMSGYPPFLEVDEHEDEADLLTFVGHEHERYSTYCYVSSLLGFDDPIAREVIRLLSAYDIPFQKTGWTRFGEWIENGVVIPDEGEGSVDEFLGIDTYIYDGVVRPKPAAKCCIVTETPTMRLMDGAGSVRIPLEERVQAQGAVIQALPRLWKLAQYNYR